jgi:hypothetical protein
MTNRDITLASLAKVARTFGTSFVACVAFVKELGNHDDTKDTFIENYAAGFLSVKATMVATIRLRAAPDAKQPNAHGQRTVSEHKAIRAAEVAWIRVRDAAGFKPAKRSTRADNARKPAPAPTAQTASESKVKPMTLEAVTLPTMASVHDALGWISQLAIKGKTFRNANAKLFDQCGDSGMQIRDALAALTRAIDTARHNLNATKPAPKVVVPAEAEVAKAA